MYKLNTAIYGAAVLGKGKALAFLATKINEFENFQVAPADKKHFIVHIV